MTPEPDSAEDRVFVRDATAEDIIAVATIWHTGWRDGHAGHVSAEVAQQRTLADFERRTVARLATIRVATVGDRVVRAWWSSPLADTRSCSCRRAERRLDREPLPVR